MRALVIIGVLLILLGVFSLGFNGITFFTRETVAKAGPMEVQADRPHTIWFHPALGAGALVGGIALTAIGVAAASRKS